MYSRAARTSEVRSAGKSLRRIFAASGHSMECDHAAPFIAEVYSPRLTTLAETRGFVSAQRSPPHPRWHSSSSRNDPCLPLDIQTVAPCVSASSVDALVIWLASQTVPSCAAAYQ